MAQPINISNLCIDVGGTNILRSITMDIGLGWHGLLGCNGSGKTTLLRGLVGRISIKSGSITIEGQELTHKPKLLAEYFGDAPPLHSLPISLRVGELIILIKQSRCENAENADELRQILDISAIENKDISTLSSGMKQRLSIYLAFLGQPKLIILDEPFNWLDPVVAYELKLFLAEYAKRVPVMTALHDISTFANYCDQGLLLHEGAIEKTYNKAMLNELRSKSADLEYDIYKTLSSLSE